VATQQRGANAVSSSPPENAENAKREQRAERVPIIRGVFIILLGLLPLSNALGDLPIQAIRPINVIRLVAAGWCFGMGVGLMSSRFMIRAADRAKPQGRKKD